MNERACPGVGTDDGTAYADRRDVPCSVAHGAGAMGTGPRSGLDTLYSSAMLLILVFGVQTGRAIYFEVALVIALLGFAATAALAKFLMRGEVIE